MAPAQGCCAGAAVGTQVVSGAAVREMLQPCPVYLHAISLVVLPPPVGRDGRRLDCPVGRNLIGPQFRQRGGRHSHVRPREMIRRLQPFPCRHLAIDETVILLTSPLHHY